MKAGPGDPLAFGRFTADGRMAGCFVYMLFCQDGGPIYVKIGISARPTARLDELRTTCAVSPRAFSVIEVRNLALARKIELALHRSFAKHQTTGEWFVFPSDQGGAFQARRRELIDKFDTDPIRPLKWSTVSVKPIAELAKKRRKYFARLYARRRARMGIAYRDFKRGLARGDPKE